MEERLLIVKASNNIQVLFDYLDRWRNLPSYQLERRADIFFAMYLEKIIETEFGIKVTKIIPEFPLRKKDIDPLGTNQSFHIDYLVVAEDAKKIFFIELKTDMASWRTAQDDYLHKAKEINIPKIVDGLIEIYKATRQKKKYRYLFEELIHLGWAKEEGKTYINTSSVYDIEVIYIQPKKTHLRNQNIITFQNIIDILSSETDELTKRFVQSLEVWKNEI